MTRVSPGSAPSMKKGPVRGLSILMLEKGSPGFCRALPKQSRELASRILPGLRWATGSAGPKVGLTLSMEARKWTTLSTGDCARVLVRKIKDDAIRANDRRRKGASVGIGKSEFAVQHDLAAESIGGVSVILEGLMRLVVAAVVEREDRRLLIGQRRRDDSSALKWEFPGKSADGEGLMEALAREFGRSWGRRS